MHSERIPRSLLRG